MGWLKLRASDLKLANDDSLFDPDVFIDSRTGEKRTAEQVIHWCETKARGLGMKIVQKPKSSLKLSKFGSTYYGEIRLPMDYNKRSAWRNAALWAHEIMHALQWRKYKRFGSRYIFNTRWRWAIEMQCYRVSVRAWRHFGKNPTNYIDGQPDSMRNSYACKMIRQRDIEKHTVAILRDAYESWPT